MEKDKKNTKRIIAAIIVILVILLGVKMCVNNENSDKKAFKDDVKDLIKDVEDGISDKESNGEKIEYPVIVDVEDLADEEVDTDIDNRPPASDKGLISGQIIVSEDKKTVVKDVCNNSHCANGDSGNIIVTPPKPPTPPVPPVVVPNVKQLVVSGTELRIKNGDSIEIRGISSHGLNWYGEYVNAESLQYVKDNLGINLIRLMMMLGSEDTSNGYILNPTKNKADMIKLVDLAISKDMYVIIDWHVLTDKNPNVYKAEALVFFDEMSKKYANVPNVIFEICNEPNGPTTWDDIYDYAMDVIPVIRANSPEAIVIVGTPNFSQNTDAVLARPLPFANVMYSYHYYLQESGNKYKAQTLINFHELGIPVFVSEFGTGKVATADYYLEDFHKLLAQMRELKMPWVYFVLSPPAQPDQTNRAFFDDTYTIGDDITTHLGPTVKYLIELLKERPSASSTSGALVKPNSGWSKTVYAVSDGDGNTIPIPVGFYYVGGTKNTGVVISDSKDDKDKGVDATLTGNQFVFVPVNTHQRANWNDYVNYAISIEPAVTTTYTSMVNKHGGFYISRYEAGIPKDKEATWNLSTSKYFAGMPQSVAGVVPWNFLKWNAAKTTSIKMYAISSSSMTENTVDPVLTNYEIVISDMTSSSDYDSMINWISSTNSTFTGVGTYDATYGNTGKYKINNVYDIVGNMREYTTEGYIQTTNSYSVLRGAYVTSIETSLKTRTGFNKAYNDANTGFRISLYMK